MALRADLALLSLTGLGIVADVVCTLTGHTPPGIVDQVVIAGLAGAAGVALPTSSGVQVSQPPAAPQAPAAAPYSGPVG